MLEPFNKDCILHAEVARLIGKWGISVAFETGTHIGDTAIALSLLCEQVHTVEISKHQRAIALSRYDEYRWFRLRTEAQVPRNVHYHLGSSPDVILQVAPGLAEQRLLFYLDAHWGKYWPLQDELKAIHACTSIAPVLVIHDFCVPGRLDLGFDRYGGQKLDMDYVAEKLHLIYADKCQVSFNAFALGARRGALFVEPTE